MIRKSTIVLAVAAVLVALGSQAFAEGDAYLGVEVAKLTDVWRAKLGCTGDGVVVLSVMEGSPAEAAGIEEGDVIRKIEDATVPSPGMLAEIISEKSAGDTVKVVLFRTSKDVTVSAVLKARKGVLNDFPHRVKRFFYVPQEKGRNGFGTQILPERRPKWIGVRIEPLTGQLAQHFGVEKGLLIAEVVSEAPAEKAGLKAGDVILEAGGTQAGAVEDIKKAVAGKKAGEILPLKIVREGTEMTIEVPVEENPNAFQNDRGIRSWFHDLQQRFGSPSGGEAPEAEVPSEQGAPSCGAGGTCRGEDVCSDGPGAMWGASEELHTQIQELRERLEKMEKELKELREKVHLP